jgi:hypothetical protein
VTYMQMCRALALQESKAIRGYARAGFTVLGGGIDYWAEWQRIARSNGSTFKAAS